MWKTVAVACAVLVVACSLAAGQDVTGDWIGTISRPTTDLRVAVHIGKNDNGLYGTLDSIDQGVTGIPLDSVKLSDSKLTFENSSTGVSYEGKVAADAKTIEGMVTGASGTRPLVFRRGTFPKVEHKPGKPTDIDGDWAGTLKGAEGEFEMVFHIVNTEEGLIATLDIPDQNVKGATASTVKREGASVVIDWKVFGSVFSGQISDDKQTMSGTMAQRGAAIPITLTRKKA